MKRTCSSLYCLLVAVFLFLLTGPWLVVANEGKTYQFVALTNVRIIDAKNERPVENGTLIIKGNTIASVGEADKIDIPKNAEIINLKGKTIMPGLIDVHCHVTLQELGSFNELENQSDAYIALSSARNFRTILESGVTTIRDVGGVREITSSLKKALSMKLISGPRFYHAGRPIANSGGHAWSFAEIADGKEEIIRSIRRRFAEGAYQCDFIKVMWNLPQGYSEEEIKIAIETVHKYGKKIAIHAYQPETVDACVRYGADTIEHAHKIDARTIPLAIKNKTIIVPTLLWSGKPLDEKSNNKELEKRRKIWWKMTLDALRPYVAAGGLIAMGTDCGSFPVIYSDGPDELILHKELGMTPFQIIQAGTINGAKAIGIEDKIGTLEEGKWADIIVLDGNPLEDLTALKRLSMVILDGKVVVDKR